MTGPHPRVVLAFHLHAHPAAVYLWLHIGFGWFLTALGVAGVTGLVKKDH